MDESYQPTDRRPLSSREKPFWQKTAAILAARRVSPNGISLGGMICGIVAGIGLAGTAHVGPWIARLLWLLAAALAQLRLTANLLDGMVAIASGRASAVGELYNEIPDRISDAAIFIGAGFATGGDLHLGYLAACLAILTAYIRAVGKASGVRNLYLGPMAKQHRMFAMTVLCLYMALTPAAWHPTWSDRGLPAAVLGLIVVGSVITCIRRTARIARTLKGEI